MTPPATSAVNGLGKPFSNSKVRLQHPQQVGLQTLLDRSHHLSRQLPPGWAAEVTEGFKVEGIQQAFLSDPSVEAQRGQRAQLWLDIHAGGRWAGLPAGASGEARASGKEATARETKDRA